MQILRANATMAVTGYYALSLPLDPDIMSDRYPQKRSESSILENPVSCIELHLSIPYKIAIHQDSNTRRYTYSAYCLVTVLLSSHAPKSRQAHRSLRTTNSVGPNRSENRLLLRKDALARLSHIPPYRRRLQQRDHPALGHFQSSHICHLRPTCP